MKIVISKTRMERAVKNIGRVINTKNALPILGDILCTVSEEEETITMTGADGEMWLTYEIGLDACEGGGSFCIGAELLRDALAELKEQPLTILATTESDMKFRLQHESGETVLPMEASNEYPTPRRVDSQVNEWILDSGMLKRVLRRTMFATCNDDLRPVLSGIYFNQNDNTLDIVASNGHVLTRTAVEVSAENLPDSFILPKKAANLLPSFLDMYDETYVTFDDRAVAFRSGDMTLVALMIEGKYPNYKSIIPDDAPYDITVDRTELLKALRNVAHFTNDSSRLLKMNIGNDSKMRLYGEDFDFMTEANDTIEIIYKNGKEMQIGVKADSIIDELSRITEPKVSILYTDPSRAVTITPIDPIYNEQLTMLLMPMLVNE